MLTVLIATRNRATILSRTLDAFCRLHPPEGSWKCVVVDNGSTDGTAETVERYSTRLPITFLKEPQPGKSTALNTGMAAVEGDLVVFADDDVLVPPDWLVQYRNAAGRYPEVSIFAGPVHAKWPFPPPKWATANLLLQAVAFGVTDPTLRDGPLTDSGLVRGANFAVRTNALAPFDCSIGPRGTHYAMGSEAELVGRLLRQGHRLQWVEAVPVEHVIEPAQLSKWWVLGRAIRVGRGGYRISYYAEGHPTMLLGLPRWVIRQALLQGVRLIVSLFRLNGSRAFEALWNLLRYCGMCVESRRLPR